MSGLERVKEASERMAEAMDKTMLSVTKSGTHIEQLTRLAEKLAARIDTCQSDRDYVALTRQYRETITAINLMNGDDGDDELDRIANIPDRLPASDG